MYSGIQIHSSVISTFDKMKLLSTKSKKLLRLCLSEDGGHIVVDNRTDVQEQSSQDNYQNFLKHLLSDEACFLIYDVSYETHNSPIKEDLVFVQWCPEAAPPKQRMQFASTMNVLWNKLEGIKLKIQATSLDEISRSVLAEKLGNDVIKIEGVPV